VDLHAVDTVCCTQEEAMILAAEKRSRQRPRRCTELLEKWIEASVQSRAPAERRLTSQRAGSSARRKQETVTQLQEATNPKRISVLERRCVRREKAVQVAMEKPGKTQVWLSEHLEQFEQENAENPQTLAACCRLDAGFNTYENIALLIEMGYEVYVKLHNHKIVQMLKKTVTLLTA
jgi:hypothetical protein